MQTAKVRILFFFKEAKRCFPVFTRQRSWIAFFVQGGLSGWLAGKKSSSLRSGIFFAKPCHKKQPIQKPEACKNREKPSRWDYSLIKNKSMKQLQLIGSIGRLAVTGFLLIGTVLLWNKGIVPIYTIAILLVAGSLTGWVFRIIGLVIRLSLFVFILSILV